MHNDDIEALPQVVNFELPVQAPPGRRPHVRDLDAVWLAARRIRTARHCFGCTAGAGSSCGGATT